MVSGFLGKELPGNRLRVRIPCSPLIPKSPLFAAQTTGFFRALVVGRLAWMQPPAG